MDLFNQFSDGQNIDLSKNIDYRPPQKSKTLKIIILTFGVFAAIDLLLLVIFGNYKLFNFLF